jgi:hypothetical protein
MQAVRWHKKGPRKVNIRPGIASLEVLPAVEHAVTLSMLLHEAADRKAKPQEVVQALLDLDEDRLRTLRVYKHEAFICEDAHLTPVLRYTPCARHDQHVTLSRA